MDVDPFVAAEPSADGDALLVTLGSGRTVRVTPTVPLPGVLRLRSARPARRDDDSPMLVPLEEHPATLTRTPDGVEISGPEVRAHWDAGVADGVVQGLRFGTYARFATPEADTVPHPAGYRPAGDGQPAGWLETVHLAPDAAVYGGGESYQGINLRGRRRELRNTEQNRDGGRDSAYLNIPLLWSDAGWGLFAHTGAQVVADIGATHSEALLLRIDGEDLDLFLLAGDAPTVLARYLALTGRPRALPEWAFGVWMSRSSYFTADEVVETVDELRRADCPVDVIHVDEWLDQSVLDDPTWSTEADRSRFPEGWARRLAERGVRLSLWINPYVRRDSPLGRELAARGYLVRDARGEPVAVADEAAASPVDFTHPEAREWWCERLAATLRTEHNAAVLADFGEEIPDDAVFAAGYLGADWHNTYGLIYQDTVHEAGRRARGGDFVAVSRSGTAGSQRDPAHWAGDLPSTWSGMVSTLRAVLSMALSGCSVITHDAGGFWTPASYRRAGELRATMTPDAVEADVDPELYARWAQWASFSALTRFHGMGRREPFAYPEPFASAAIAACRLRQRMRRYLVASAESAVGGLPLVWPMPLAYPGDRIARDAWDQYLLGRDVLVAPLLEPGGARRLWVPEGEWTGLVGCPTLVGPGWHEVRCGIDQFPAYVRAERGPEAVLS
ncbi:glycoside hydrolase family 31 protein [Streptomyces sedi]|uniref:Glycoside hydrolase family 31 protein n=1 Tax=Streptomyces sedi TaxID=555059 RepID=A0A5C4V543_9ACTN|nr:TIM-barrel domain-containing protein [Streptomyces sedi]TNM30715.1 glycoside hydrolase family 31 protein [Streptomyces sedi]